MWIEDLSVADVLPHVTGMALLPAGVPDHANLTEIKEVLRTAFVWSPTEMRLLAAIRSQHVPILALPARLPSWMTEHATNIQDRITSRYASMVASGHVPETGVHAVLDAIQGAYLAPWIPAPCHAELLTPVRSLLGPPQQGGMGPRYAQVARILLNVNGLTHSQATQLPACDSTDITTHAAVIRDTCEIAGRASALRRAQESLNLLTGTLPAPTRNPQYRSRIQDLALLAIGAVIVCDLLPESAYLNATRPWQQVFPEPPASAKDGILPCFREQS